MFLERSDFRREEDSSSSDLNIIVTCTVKTATSNRMIHRIRELGRTRKPLIVAGCMPRTERKTVESLVPGASLVGPNSLDRITESAHMALGGKRGVFLESSELPKTDWPRVRKVPIIHISEIASGCLSACSFCQVKIARGGLVSYPMARIVEEVRNAVKKGCKEVWLTSQDNGAYGKDIKTNLPELLENVSSIEGDFMIRVGMMNPMHLIDMDDELAEAYRNRRVFKFLHLPVQSGSDRILRLMLRQHTASNFFNIVEIFRRKIPQITLSTDVIVGFPTETEEEHLDSMDLLKKVEPDVVNVSRYSARPGTSAADMEQLSPLIAKDRSNRMHGLVKEIANEKNKRWMGWRGEVIIDEEKDNGVVGRNYAYKPVFLRQSLPLGSMPDVCIEKVSPACLMARKIGSTFHHPRSNFLAHTN